MQSVPNIHQLNYFNNGACMPVNNPNGSGLESISIVDEITARRFSSPHQIALAQKSVRPSTLLVMFAENLSTVPMGSSP